jgi:hypothetical protein
MLTIGSLPAAKGVLSSKDCCGGMSPWTEACKSAGSQSSHFNSSFAKSQIVSENTPHSKGHGAPPKVNQRVIIAAASSGSCVAAFSAVTEWRIPLRQADL